MVEMVGSGIAPQKLFLKKETVETFLSATAQRMMAKKERLRQKRDKFIQSVPVLDQLNKKWKTFDTKMETKHGQVYTKIRDSAKNIARTVLAAKLFGLPGVVGMCAYKTCEKAMSLLEPAQKAKDKGETKSILDYLKKNKEEARFTTTSGAISICTAACDVLGAPLAKGAFRVGKASWLIAPEVKKLAETTGKWMRGEESFVEVKRDAAVMGITFGTYFVSSVPMTHGSGKPKETPEAIMEKAKRAEKTDPAEEKVRSVITKGREYMDQVRDALNKGIGNPSGMITVFDIKKKKEGR
ncbi:MAG: hypothetical protein IJ752_02625 [Alphaproteobacteria bacterium]|nr:hypothetical protein [Alphaproteobacteria bacterium]